MDLNIFLRVSFGLFYNSVWYKLNTAKIPSKGTRLKRESIKTAQLVKLTPEMISGLIVKSISSKSSKSFLVP